MSARGHLPGDLVFVSRRGDSCLVPGVVLRDAGGMVKLLLGTEVTWLRSGRLIPASEDPDVENVA